MLTVRPINHERHFVSTYRKALSLVKERLGASGVQLGRKVVVDAQEIIEFIAASEGREDMVGKVQYARLPRLVLSCKKAIIVFKLSCYFRVIEPTPNH